MKTTILKSATAAIGLTTLIILALTPAPVSGQPASARVEERSEASSNNSSGKDIEGVWDSLVSIRDCQTGTLVRAFRGLGLFISGGSLIQTNNTPNAPTTSGPSFGTWEHLGQRRYTATFRFFRFNPDGTFAGVQKVQRTIELNQDGDQFTSAIVFEVYDANDHLIQIGCGTETAARLQ